jgi:hypothetical protein
MHISFLYLGRINKARELTDRKNCTDAAPLLVALLLSEIYGEIISSIKSISKKYIDILVDCNYSTLYREEK